MIFQSTFGHLTNLFGRISPSNFFHNIIGSVVPLFQNNRMCRCHTDPILGTDHTFDTQICFCLTILISVGNGQRSIIGLVGRSKQSPIDGKGRTRHKIFIQQVCNTIVFVQNQIFIVVKECHVIHLVSMFLHAFVINIILYTLLTRNMCGRNLLTSRSSFFGPRSEHKVFIVVIQKHFCKFERQQIVVGPFIDIARYILNNGTQPDGGHGWDSLLATTCCPTSKHGC
mmetsp:Transcript_19937/g.29524  ORF Transcript_19937/g.29524 Transcript_19937/m.29524 type:complete len:227 (+) Transcript_19937:562-1242(+)